MMVIHDFSRKGWIGKNEKQVTTSFARDFYRRVLSLRRDSLSDYGSISTSFGGSKTFIRNISSAALTTLVWMD